MTCGIYSITNKTNKKVYIGSSKNCEQRFKQHKKELRGEYHKNDHLQKAINKYGIDNFDFKIIDKCDQKDLIYTETLWMNHLNTMDSIIGYNKRSPDNNIISQETKDKIKKSHNTPKYKQWLKKNAKENIWGNNEVKKRLLKNQWISMHTQEHKKLKSKQRKLSWDLCPENKDKYTKIFKEKWNNEESPNRNKKFKEWLGSDEQRKVMSVITKDRWKNPEERKKMVAARKKFGATKEFKNKISEITKDRWSDKKFKNKMAKKRKEIWNDPEFKQKMKKAKELKLAEPIQCIVCHELFIRNVYNQKICSKKCKNLNRKNKKSLGKI